MPTFIKPGFWEKAKKGYNHWLNLDDLITSLIPVTPPVTLPYKSYVAKITHEGGISPIIQVPIDNTIGSVSWEVEDSTNYGLVSAGLFTLGKTVVFATSPTFPLMNIGVGLSTISPNFIGLTTDNDTFNNLMFEVRVYN